MAELSDRTPRATGGRMRRRGAVLVLAAATLALSALATPWPARGLAQPAACVCETPFKLHGLKMGVRAREQGTAITRAGNAAIQEVRDQEEAYQCPAACPVLATIDAPFVIPGSYGAILGGDGWYYGYAEAEGEYMCVPAP